MEKKETLLHRAIIKMPNFLEKIVAAILLVGVIYGGFHLIIDAFAFTSTANMDALEYIEALLASAFSVIIVIEFVRMLVRHSMNTIIEVLLFCRKFLFKEFDFEEEE